MNAARRPSIVSRPLSLRAALARAAILLACIAPAAHGQALLFSSGFESGTTLRAISQSDCFTTGCWQYVDGTDLSTGFTWPPSLWGGSPTAIQLLADHAVDATNVRDYGFNQLITLTGHTGNRTQVLYSSVTQSGCCGGDSQDAVAGASQNAFQIQPASESGDLYISYWLRFQPDLDRQLNAPNPGWRYVFSWKTGSSGGVNDGDYRVIVQIVTWCPGALFCWETRGDNAAGSESYVEYWLVQNMTVPVPIGEWFKFEVFWHRSTGADGRFWAAVNGNVIADHSGPNKIAKDINRILLTDAYGSGRFPMYQWLDDLRLYDSFPGDCPDPPCAAH